MKEALNNSVHKTCPKILQIKLTVETVFEHGETGWGKEAHNYK